MEEDPKIQPSKYTILAVDDEELLRNLLFSFLSTLGHSCVTANDGVDALEKLLGNKIDAVVTDIKMPKMDGIILTKEILRKYPGLPVMVMTGFDEEYSAGTAISIGAREFIRKPFSLDEFTIRLYKMIAESETPKRAGSEGDIGKDIQKSPDEIEPSKRTKSKESKEEFDEEILKFIDEIETLSRRKRVKEADGNPGESEGDWLAKFLNKS